MKKDEPEADDNLQPEYDLKSLRVRKLGPERGSFGWVIRSEPDVAEVFPDADAANEALRLLIRIAKGKKPDITDAKGDLG
ncbi:MAG TPA: hypothetical protein VN256_26455 [Pyrinomonadaceae bacterium]|nr:hypothetical protein [Pyrinomonadaceae bacterium]